jgi:hypothetical protein
MDGHELWTGGSWCCDSDPISRPWLAHEELVQKDERGYPHYYYSSRQKSWNWKVRPSNHAAPSNISTLRTTTHNKCNAIFNNNRTETQETRPKSKPRSRNPNTFPPVKNLTLEDSDAIIIFGGYNPQLPLEPDNDPREIYQLNPLENQWTLMGLMPEPRLNPGVVHISGTIIIFGEKYLTRKYENEIIHFWPDFTHT